MLWLGKMALSDVPHIVELRDRGVLVAPLLLAALSDRPGAQERLARITAADGPCRLDRRSSMRIGFVVNDVHTEQPQYTTTRLAMAASRRGHEVWLMGVGDFSHRGDGSIAAKARKAPGKRSTSLESYLRAVQSPKREPNGSRSTSSTCS